MKIQTAEKKIDLVSKNIHFRVLRKLKCEMTRANNLGNNIVDKTQ